MNPPSATDTAVARAKAPSTVTGVTEAVDSDHTRALPHHGSLPEGKNKLTGTDTASHAPERWRLAMTILVVAGTVVLASGVIATYATDVWYKRLFDNIHWTVGYSAAAMIAWLGAHKNSSADARAQRWFAWALTAYAGGQMLWDLQVAIGWNPFPGPSDLLFLCLGALFAIGLLDYLRRAISPGQFRAALLDIAGLSVAVQAVTLALYLPRRGDTELLPMIVLVTYPTILTSAACIALIVTLIVQPALRTGRILFLCALIANGALWMEWNSRTLDATLVDGGWYNLCFSMVALAQGLGVFLWRTEPTRSARWRRFCVRTLHTVPIVTVILGATAVALAHTLPDVPEIVRHSSLISGLLVLVLAVMRQSVLLTERERVIQLERSLRMHEEAYHMLVEQAVDGIFVSDQSGRYVDVNSAGAAMLGMTREQVLQLSIVDIVPPEELPRVPGEVQMLLDGSTLHKAWRLKRKDGSIFEAEVSSKMLPDGRLQGIVRDVSERKALEEQLRQAQKMEAVGTLAAGIAHDFNNLLMAIRGFTEIAAEDVGPENPAQTSLGEIRKASTRASQLVRQIMAFSRPHTSDIKLMQLSSVVDEVFRLLRATLPAGVELTNSHQPDTPLVAADPAQVHQVLLNLITNSWHALKSPLGKIEVHVKRVLVDATMGINVPAGIYACLTVTDNGTGMDRITRDRIFEPFFTTKRAGEGSGLGLAMVHSIVRNHAGAITVDSTPGAGTTIRVYFPEAKNIQTEHTEPSVGTDSAHRTGHRVFYVDDEQSLVTLVSTQLDRRGYRVTGYSDCSAALDAIRANPHSLDVLVTDQNMPKMSGFDLLLTLRTMGIDTPCVLISGYFDEEVRTAIPALALVRLAQKPVAIQDLCTAIDELVGQAQPAASRSKVGDSANRKVVVSLG